MNSRIGAAVSLQPQMLDESACERQRQVDLKMCSMPEVNPPNVQPCRLPGTGSRLNLVIPVVSSKLSFAGMLTARRLFLQLLERFDFARVIVTHESVAAFDAQSWAGWTLDDPTAKRSIVFLGKQDDWTIDVAVGDFFIATCWTAAMFIEAIVPQYATLFQRPARRYVYLIQEYEPGLYPASPEYELAASTYQHCERYIAVLNSKALADAFVRLGIEFPHRYVHDPLLDVTLEAQRQARRGTVKEKLIFIYARPTLLRNGFRLLVEGVKKWAKTYPESAQWSVVSAGGKHPVLHLANGVSIESHEKLSLEAYADLLAKSWVGLSLMFGAHPGQVPQEVAEFGSWSISNVSPSRDPAAIASNMIGLKNLLPSTIATALADCCSTFQPGRTSVTDGDHRVFRRGGAEFEFLDALFSEWQSA